MQSLKKHQQESRKLSVQIKNRDQRIAQLEGQRGQLEAAELAPTHSSQPQRDGDNNVAPGDGGGQGVFIGKTKEKGKESKKSNKSSDRKRDKDCIDGGGKKEGKKGEVFNI